MTDNIQGYRWKFSLLEFCSINRDHEKKIENWKYRKMAKICVPFKGIDRRLSVLQCMNYKKRMSWFCFYTYMSKIKSEIGWFQIPLMLLHV